MVKYLLPLLFLSAFIGSASGQTARAPFCGMAEEHIQELETLLLENKARLAQDPVAMRAPRYIPIKFHLVARNDGTGRVEEFKVLDDLCLLNEIFAEFDVQFYIKDGFNYLDNTAGFTDPRRTLNTVFSFSKDREAMNIFIVGNADSGDGESGVTLGFYSTPNDLIVLNKSEMGRGSKALAHEIGHFFSLLHTHHGWDSQPWTPEIGNPSPSISPGNVPTEKADGSNGERAGDYIADTPADYNGLLWDNCNYNSGARDPDSILIDPDERNIMSYFQVNVGGCSPLMFSETQKNLMLTDIASSRRRALRTEGENFSPVVISGQPTLKLPLDGGDAPGGSGSVRLEWEPVEGASNYLVEIDRVSSFSIQPVRVDVTTNSAEISGLALNKKYFWRVRPYNEYTACRSLASDVFSFTVTDRTTAVNTIDFVDKWSVSPNPVIANSEFFLEFQTNEYFEADITLYNLSGQVVRKIGRTRFTSGANRLNIPTANLPSGIYLLSLVAREGQLTQKVVVLE